MKSDTPTDLVPARGTRLGDLLYPEPADRRVGAIVRWWEARRLPYNLVVAGSGVLSLGVIGLFQSLPPHAPGFGFSLFPLVVYGLLANLCFGLGPSVEIAVEKLSGGRILPTGPLLFRAGLTFAVGLTLVLPTIIMTIGYVLRIIGVFS